MKEIKATPRNEPWVVTFLSLFLILLAFFILLNALATIEETKARKALTSVAATFRSVVNFETRAQILVSDLGPTPEAQEVIEALEQLWVTAVPIAKVEKLTKGQVMQMTIPVNELFLGGRAVLRADREALFDQTGLILALETRGGITEAEVVFGTRRADHTLADAEGRLAAERAGRIAAALVGHDAPADRIAIGLRDGDPALLRVRFESREGARSQVTFKKEGGP
jgi:hypothetical protein